MAAFQLPTHSCGGVRISWAKLADCQMAYYELHLIRSTIVLVYSDLNSCMSNFLETKVFKDLPFLVSSLVGGRRLILSTVLDGYLLQQNVWLQIPALSICTIICWTMADDLPFPDSVKDFVFDLHDASRRSFISGEQLGLYQTIFREITAKVRIYKRWCMVYLGRRVCFMS